MIQHTEIVEGEITKAQAAKKKQARSSKGTKKTAPKRRKDDPESSSASSNEGLDVPAPPKRKLQSSQKGKERQINPKSASDSDDDEQGDLLKLL